MSGRWLRTTTALGAAYAAGLAIGFWQNLTELREQWAVDKTWFPQMELETKQRLCTRWKKAVEKSLDWI